jgi:hypothetical protein
MPRNQKDGCADNGKQHRHGFVSADDAGQRFHGLAISPWRNTCQSGMSRTAPIRWARLVNATAPAFGGNAICVGWTRAVGLLRKPDSGKPRRHPPGPASPPPSACFFCNTCRKSVASETEGAAKCCRDKKFMYSLYRGRFLLYIPFTATGTCPAGSRIADTKLP